MLDPFTRPEGNPLKDALLNTVAMTAFGLCFVPIIAGAVTYDAGRSVVQSLLEKGKG